MSTITHQPHHRPTRAVPLLLSGLALLALAVGCGDHKHEQEPAATTAQAQVPEEPTPPPPKPKPNPYPAYVDKVAEQLSDRALAAAENGQAASMSPISSSRIVPLSATRNIPGRSSVALV